MTPPTTPGFYLTGHSGLMVLDDNGTWRGTYSNARIIDPAELPSDLVRLVDSDQAGGVFDRDQAREVLRPFVAAFTGGLADAVLDEALDLLAGCVRPATIDRDALLEILRDALGQHRLDGSVAVGTLADRIVALVRPVVGVTLSPEEAARALDWCRRSVPAWSPEDEALAARLEAAS